MSSLLLSPDRESRLRQWKRVLSSRARHGVATKSESERLTTIRTTLYCLSKSKGGAS